MSDRVIEYFEGGALVELFETAVLCGGFSVRLHCPLRVTHDQAAKLSAANSPWASANATSEYHSLMDGVR